MLRLFDSISINNELDLPQARVSGVFFDRLIICLCENFNQAVALWSVEIKLVAKLISVRKYQAIYVEMSVKVRNVARLMIGGRVRPFIALFILLIHILTQYQGRPDIFRARYSRAG